MERTALTQRVNALIGRGLCAAHGAAPERGYAAPKAAFRGVSDPAPNAWVPAPYA